MSLFKDISTCKDGESYDVARWIMVINAVSLVVVLILGVTCYLYGYLIGKPFDLQTLFTAVLTYAGGVGALLTTGAAAIFFKRSTEPNDEPPKQ